jgi:hypothetical protein
LIVFFLGLNSKLEKRKSLFGSRALPALIIFQQAKIVANFRATLKKTSLFYRRKITGATADYRLTGKGSKPNNNPQYLYIFSGFC